MSKFLIKLRKKWWFPTKWKIEEKKTIANMTVRSEKEIFHQERLLKEKRTLAKLGNGNTEAIDANLRFIKWLTYGST